MGVIRRYPASHAQRGLWFLQRFAPESAAWNVMSAWRIGSPLDVNALRDACLGLSERHDAFRTTYRMAGDVLMAEVRERGEPLVLVDARGWTPEELLQRVSDEAHRPFDLEHRPLFRPVLFTAAPGDHVLLLSAHHAAGDGRSNLLVMKELGALYQAYVAGRPPSPPPRASSCEEFARWQAELLAGPEGERLWSFWQEQLAGDLPRLDLPAERPRKPVRRHRGAAETIVVDGDLATALHRLARIHGTTLFVVLLAAFQALLARYTGHEDIAVGSVAHGRTVPRFRRTIGNLMNQVILRTDIAGAPSFTDLVQRARATVRAALAHQAYPFSLLVERLAPVRDPGRSTLCDVTFGLTYLVGEGRARVDWGQSSLTALPVPRRTSQTDLDVQLVESARGMNAVFQYDTDHFDAETIRRLGRHYLGLLQAFCANPTRRIAEAPLLTESERASLIAGWVAGPDHARREVPPSPSGAPSERERMRSSDPLASAGGEGGGEGDGSSRVEALVEAQVDRAPDAPAVSGGGWRFSYRTLDERANQVAHRLRRLGVGPDVPVAICVNRSPNLVVGLLGILKAGGAYVPLDPSLPPVRLNFAIKNAGARALVTEERCRSLFSPSIPIISLDGDAAALDGEPLTRLPRDENRSSRDVAYIIYTSGSTGSPKGVAVEHRSVVNAVRDVVRRLRLGPADVWTAITTVAFDVASLEIWGALAAGARLDMLDLAAVTDGERLAAAMREARTTVLRGTPTLWRLLLETGWAGQPGLKMIAGGEPLTRELVEVLLRRGAELWNQYGPTETAMYVTTEQITRSGLPPTIGRPIPNVRAYVLDERGEPVPVGVAGELWIAGVQVARGYVNRPEETARCFEDDPWFPGERRYRTGDRARHRADGRLEYLGRLDAQVKIRGYRVEPGEIEAAIESHPAVQSAVVLATGSRRTGQSLAAYLVARDPRSPPAAEDLRALLRARLPGPMVPAEFTLLEALPLTPSGKVDRRAVARAVGNRLDRGMPGVAPRTGLEDTLARIWAEVLEIDGFAVHDDFFDLGGHSLLATQVVSRLRETLQVDLALRDLFEAPTVAGLAERIASHKRDGRARDGAAIGGWAQDGPAPLSFSQERMWFLHRLAPDSPALNAPAAVRMRGVLDREALAAAFRDLVHRHEVLRTVFPAVDGRPVQVVTQHQPDIALADLEVEPAAVREARARDILREEACRAFDLARGPVVRALLLRLDAADHVLLVNMHHIVCDQWSFGVLGRELMALYNAHLHGQPSPLPPLPIQFADFAAWQREWLSGPVLEAQLAYWRRHLAGPLPVLELPTDRPRPAIPSYQGGRQTRHLGPALVAAVEELSRREQASVFMTLVAGFNALLARYSGQDEILLGVPIANRNHLASESLVGALVNMLPLRTGLSGDPSFRELLRRVRETLLDAYGHQEMPFAKLVQELQPERYTSHSPLVQVLVNLLNAPMPRQQFEGLSWEMFEFDRGVTQFDLTLSVGWGQEGWLRLEYSSDLFERATVARMLGHLETFLEAAVADPDRCLSGIPLLLPEEREQLLATWNRTVVPCPDDSIHALFEAQADRTPDALAVAGSGASLTYRELDRRANQLARHLQALGVGPGTVVGVCLERSSLSLVGLLGVLKAGGAFLPLDPAYPPGRLAFMVADSGAPVVLTDERHAALVPGAGVELVRLDAAWPTIARQGDARGVGAAVGGDRPAYVIYTSGSIGTPKGVLAPHRGAVNRFRWMWRTYPFARDEVCCHKTSTSFVDSIWEIFGPLLQGVPTVVIPDGILREPRSLIRTLAEHRVTRIVLVPSLLRALLEAEPALGARLPHLRLWTSSGEPLGRDLAHRFREAVPGGILLNLYGASEAAGDSTCHEVGDADAHARIPIGRPIDNTQIYILDDRRQPVPVGVAGELYIAGHGLARGYLNRPDLTAEKFVANPFSGEAGVRMYRTGDRARYRSDGTIEYLGRLDSQVKIRGFRIELGEVEAALAAHPDVSRAVAVAREETTGDRRLVGYVVARNGVGPGEILDRVRGWLPGYMVPSALVLVDALPLTPSGKVNRRALPAPGAVQRAVAERPRTATEAVLADMWAAVLGLPEVGVHDDFFDLGGHSLLAAELAIRIEEGFRTTLPLRSLFEAPTVARLATLIEAAPVAGLAGPPARASGRVEIEL